ncbi:bacteriohopanetetrol glucosamine biosynthesis glycosyltransferase HpnI [Rhizosaccharibacter radicis]|uniref:Bacteriohopanetetrol glucosamine biosynthesis glycosyltransferase HpnI n=1 Tax=Rhizosaccharibacter radicis TaxID=2782605 RepID=A0ABT1W068_9PROT|nr:bacteriohopanetetrol glucosamine biosynthesis glycosyltransferase HpnI [Acetobacteraceae bacterium KSS12]
MPQSLPFVLSGALNLIAGFGCVQALVGAMLVRRFRRRTADARHPSREAPGGDPLPAVTVLKPLHGDEPMLEAALRSVCLQDYPRFQIVFGVQRPNDPAIAVVRRLQASFPHLDLTLVVDGTPHGHNRKIANLINMLPRARHDVLVISDSDIHAEPGYLREVVSALRQPGVGLVTTLYGGRPASRTLSRRLAAGQINHNFLPGVLMSRLLGRQDCLGATMALRRDTLERIGGLAALSAHVADDSRLGRLVRAQGEEIAVAGSLTITTIAETGLRDLFHHELRWGRTVRSVEPLGYALSSIQLPLFWSALGVIAAPAVAWSWGLFALVWLWRGITGFMIDGAIGEPASLPFLFLPLRDWFSAAVMLGSVTGSRVAWRGQTLHVTPRPVLPDSPGSSLRAARDAAALLGRERVSTTGS